MTLLTIGFIGLGHVGKALAAKSAQAGNRVLLSNRSGPGSLTGDEADAKHTIKELIAAMGFAPIDLGGLVEGGRLQQAGKPLTALNLLLTT